MLSAFGITQFWAVLTFLGDFALAAFMIALLLDRQGVSVPLLRGTVGFLKQHGLTLAFLVALGATMGSLIYSEVLGWEPCKLCWYQRVFMYPQVLLLGFAWMYKARDITKYVVPLSLIGSMVSSYHYYVQRLEVSTGCSLNATVSCATKYTFYFGYITIPIMALTAFLIIIVLSSLAGQDLRLASRANR